MWSQHDFPSPRREGVWPSQVGSFPKSRLVSIASLPLYIHIQNPFSLFSDQVSYVAVLWTTFYERKGT